MFDDNCKYNMNTELRSNPCVVPTQKPDFDGDGRWISMHERYVAEAKSVEGDVLFIGDSIIQQMQFSSLWLNKISALHCINFGIGGDRVEHILWRIQNGELEFIKPIKIVVLFVGTNNTSDCTPEEIFEGICKLVKAIQGKLNNVSVILPTLLPRGQFPNRSRNTNIKVNELLTIKFTDGNLDNIYVVPIHEDIVQSDGVLSHYLFHDYLHLTDQAYTKVFTPVYEKLVVLLGKN